MHYHMSFMHNYESIPKFFHLLNTFYTRCTVADINYLTSIIHTIINKNLHLLIPYYQQLLTNRNNIFIRVIIKALIKKYSLLMWNTILILDECKMNEGGIDVTDCSKEELMEYLVKQHMENKKQIKGNKKTKNNINIIDNSNSLFTLFLHSLVKLSKIFMDIAKSKENDLKMNVKFKEVFEIVKNQKITVPGVYNSYKDGPWIAGFENEIFTFKSLQKPKKITIIGSDGKKHPFILKWKDDLRKDTRFMDLNVLVNNLLSNNTNEAQIRIYDVIPFSNCSGIMKFIPHLISLKSIITEFHSQEEINSVLVKSMKKKKMERSAFVSACRKFEPVLHRFFTTKCSSPMEFYKFITNYTATAATMSVIGWFMGLGDRHCENFLIDSTTGEVVHVDLNMIFEQGKKLTIPEKVPFRLTRNVIDGFGSFQLKFFRKIFIEVLEVLRDKKDEILSNLLSFVYDPIVKGEKCDEILNESNKLIDSNLIENVENKKSLNIYGSLAKKLSDEGIPAEDLTDELIKEATLVENLRNMYIGWCSFL
ncbi:hypothetical protein NUSPORA_01375 [Nucleospora cyclopteri]